MARLVQSVSKFEGAFRSSVGLVLLCTFGCHSGHAPEPGETASQVSLERGEYLVEITGCHDCHTPLRMGPEGPEPDRARGLSGHPTDLEMPAPPQLTEGPWLWIGAATNTAFAGPWGISYATNLTPHDETGMGRWKEEMFVKALRTGKHMGQGRRILPPMPWPAYQQMTDDDLKSMFVYLKSLQPIENAVPEAILAQ